MELDDYTTPDAYAPRPRAAQEVAAQHRAQRHDDAPPAPSAAPTPRQYLPFGIGALVLIVLMIAAATWQLSHGISKPLQLTPVATVSAFAPVSPPAPSPQPPAPVMDAYAAPNGAILGPIERDREIVAVAHYGGGWIQADVTGSGRVWLRAADFPALAIVGPDLAPRAASAPPSAPQTGQGLTLDQDSDEDSSAPPAPSYLDTVGAQAPHSPRGDVVPTPGPMEVPAERIPDSPPVADSAATTTPPDPGYLETVGAQTPHRVR